MNKELGRVYAEYFGLLDRYFGHFAKEAKKHQLDAGTVAQDVLSYPRFRAIIDGFSESVSSQIVAFWTKNQDVVLKRVQKLGGLRARFGGDVGPQANSGLLNRGGLYFDTIIVPDPMLRVARLDSNIMENKSYYLLKYAINQLLMKGAYVADITPPIAVIVPDTDLTGPEPDMSELELLGERDTTLIVNELFSTSFDTFEQVTDYFGRFSDINHIAREITQPDLIWFDEDQPLTLEHQLEAFRANNRRDLQARALPFDIESPFMLLKILVGRMMQINDVYQRAVAQHAHPVISAPVSFHWLKWKLKLNRKAYGAGGPTSLDLHLANALLSDELQWLSNVPTSSLVKLRAAGQMREMRKVFRDELSTLSSLTVDDPTEVVRQVDYNLSTALTSHQSRIRDLDHRFVSDLVIPGMSLLFTITAGLVPAIYPDASHLMKIMTGAWGTLSISSLYQKANAYRKDRQKLVFSPTGILWKARSEDTTASNRN